MFLFYDSTQNETNISYFKGVLFEKLLADYLDKSGYEIEIRRKKNSLEYDLEGHDRTTGFKIIGEAKAHDKPISGEILSSFVGKLVPLGLFDKKVQGLFLSTSALTPDADDYYQKISHMGLTAKTGAQLHKTVHQTLKLPNYDPLAELLSNKGYVPQTYHILTTDHGTFLVVVAGSSSSAAPAYFCVFQKDGQMLSDLSFMTELSKAVKELQALQPIFGDKASQKNNASKERMIPKGVRQQNLWVPFSSGSLPSV